MVEYVAYGLVSYILAGIAQSLLDEGLDQPIQEQKPAQFSEEGTWIPLMIGRYRVGANQGRPWGRFFIEEPVDGEGGKGHGGGGSSSKQTVWYESGWHRIAVSAGEMYLHRIFVNGEVLWEGELNSVDDPSGTQVDLGGEGSFRVYWGEKDQPIDDYLPEGLSGHTARWPGVFHIVWLNRRLGGFAVWQAHEYEVEARPWYPGFGFGVNTGITGTRYYYNGLGQIGNVLNLNVANNDTTPSSPPRPHVGVFGNKTGVISNNGVSYIRLSEQPEISETKNFRVFSANYTSGTFYRVQNQSAVYPHGLYEYDWDLTSSFVQQGPDAGKWSFDRRAWDLFVQEPPPTSLVSSSESPYYYRFRSTASDGMTDGFHIESSLVSPYNDYTTGTQEWEIYVTNVRSQTGSIYRIDIGFENTTTPLNNKGSITWTATGVEIQEENGAEITVTNVGRFSTGPDWYKIKVRYYTENGFTSSSAGENRNLRLKAFAYEGDWNHTIELYLFHKVYQQETYGNWADGVTYDRNRIVYGTTGNLYICTQTHVSNTDRKPTTGTDWANYWSLVSGTPGVDWFANQEAFWEVPGIATSGLTRIFLDEPLQNAIAATGLVTLLGIGGTGAPGGANAAFIIQQLLFAPWPKGLGLSTDLFEYKEGDFSLQNLANLIGESGEGLRSHVLLQRGEKVRSVLNNLLLEIGITLVWNPVTGKYGFKLIRPGDVAVEIPKKAIKKAPQKTKGLGAEAPNNVIYKFLDFDKRFRTTTIPKPNDGNTDLRARLDIKEHSILSATDLEAADSIAQRIDTISGGQTNTRKFIGLRGCRNLSVGQLIRLEGENEDLRVIQVGPVDVNAVDIPVEAVVDTLSEVANVANMTAPPSGERNTSYEDLHTELIQLPQVLSPTENSFALLRIRQSASETSGIGYVSRDNTTFEQIPVTTVTGGIFLQELDSDTNFRLPSGSQKLLFEAKGPDATRLTRTLTDDLFMAGQQIAYMNGEFFFLKGISAVGENIYELTGLLRGRYSTDRATHAAGDTIYIFNIQTLSPTTHRLLYPGTIHFKSAPRAHDISTVTSASTDVDNISYSPRPVTSLRNYPYGGTGLYYAGDDFDFRWNYIHPEGRRARTGAGFQGAGEVTGMSDLYDSYFEVTISPLGYSDQVFTTTTPQYTLTNADLKSYAGGTEPIFDFKVKFVYKDRKSAQQKITMTKLSPPTAT